MSRVRVWLFRHGELPQVVPRRFVGQSDIDLSELGRRQAVYWAETLAGVPFVHVALSNLSRCRETARIVFRHRRLRLRSEPRLREIALGAWEGLTADQVRERHPGQYEARGRDLAGFRPPSGESFEDLRVRAVAALQDAVRAGREALAAADGTGLAEVGVVAHGGVNRTLLCHLLGMPLANLFRLEQDYGCLNLLEFDGEAVRVAAMNLRPGPPVPVP